MTRKTKLSYDECRVELKLFSDAAFKKHKSNSFAAGYYEVVLAEVLAELPKAKQAEFINQIRTSSVLRPTVD